MQLLNRGYIYIFSISYFFLLPSPSTRFDKEDGRGGKGEKGRSGNTKKSERWKRDREKNIYIYTHIYIEEGVAVLLVDFPFSYSI